MIHKMHMKFLVALVTILSLIPIWSVYAQDEPCTIHPDSWGVLIDSVHITGPQGFTASQSSGWDPAYMVTEFGPWDPILVTINYTITDEVPLPCRIRVVFRALGDERVVVQRKRVTGSYSVTEMFFPGGKAPGSYKIRCILRARHREEGRVGWSKAVCGITIVE